MQRWRTKKKINFKDFSIFMAFHTSVVCVGYFQMKITSQQVFRFPHLLVLVDIFEGCKELGKFSTCFKATPRCNQSHAHCELIIGATATKAKCFFFLLVDSIQLPSSIRCRDVKNLTTFSLCAQLRSGACRPNECESGKKIWRKFSKACCIG